MTTPTSTGKAPDQPNTPNVVSEPKVEPEVVLFSWKTIVRPFKKRGREYWITLISIASLLAFILFLAEGVMPVVLIVSLIFLYYILSTVNPEEVEYSITTHGIKIENNTTPWGLFLNFWFTERLGSRILSFETLQFPYRLEVVVIEKDIPKIKEILKKYVTESEFTPTYLDKAVDWMSKKLPNT